MTGAIRPLDDWLDAMGTLWPEAAVRVDRRPPGSRIGSAPRTFLVLPSARRPKMLLPAGADGLAVATAIRSSAADSLPRRLSRRGLATLLRLGMSRAFRDRVTVHPAPTTTSIEDYLAEIAGEPVRLTVAIGSARANRKPVLHAYTAAGTEIGFAKVGTTVLTNQLIRSEAATLQRLAEHGLTALDLPPVRHHGRWHDHEVLLLGALPTGGRAPRVPPVDAMREIADISATAPEPLAGGPWFTGLPDRIGRLDTDLAIRMSELTTALAKRHGTIELAHGAWHGDWGPWNMGWHQGRPQLWDWERFGTGMPVGFDAAHYLAHPALAQVGRRGAALAALARPATAAVSEVTGARPDSAVPAAVIDAYLVELACRFATDCGPDPDDWIHRAAIWRIELAEHRLATPGRGRRRAPATPNRRTR